MSSLRDMENLPYRRRAARAVLTILLLAASATAVAGSLISVYGGGRQALPAGADTPFYVWRAKLVAGQGLEALPTSLPPPLTPKASRAGYPVLAGFLHSVAGVAPYRLAFALPALAGTIAGLGAGAFALRGLREPLWTFPIYAVGVGASVNVVLTAVSHADNLIVLALCAGAAATALLAADGGRGGVATALLIGAAAAVHWPFALLFTAILAGTAVVLVPQSVSARRAGAPVLGTPSGRLGMVAAGSGAAGIASVALTPALPNLPANFDLRIEEKLRRDAPEFALLGPFAAGGAGALLVPRDPARRRGLALALVWVGSAAASLMFLAFTAFPAHRIVPFSLGVPILAAAGVAGAARVAIRIRPPAVGWAVAAVVSVAAVAAGVSLALSTWRPFDEARLEQFTQVRTAARYVRAVGHRGPVVIVAEGRKPRTPLNVVRAALPPDQIARTLVYMGDPRRLLAGRPTILPDDPAFNVTSRRTFEAVWTVLPSRPVIIALSAFRPPARPIPRGTEAAPGVTVLQGPEPPPGLGAASPPRPATAAELAGIVVRALLLVGAAGLGWAVTLLPRGWPTRLALTPALGASVLIVAGLVASRVGLEGPGSRPWIAALVAVMGWVPPAVRGVRRRPSATLPAP